MRYFFFCCGLAAMCSTGSYSQGATLDELKGLSIQVTWTQHIIGRTPPDDKYFTVHPHREIRVYVSTRGNVFDYNHVAGGPDNSQEKNSLTVFGADKAVEVSPGGSLAAWTMKDGHLTKIVQLLAGFGIYTITVDPTRLICTFDHHNEPDTKTNMVWVISPITNKPTEIQYFRTDSSTCTVKRGNIFAGDQ